MFRDAHTMRLSLSLKTRPVHVLVFKYSMCIFKAKDESHINVLGVVRTVGSTLYYSKTVGRHSLKSEPSYALKPHHIPYQPVVLSFYLV